MSQFAHRESKAAEAAAHGCGCCHPTSSMGRSPGRWSRDWVGHTHESAHNRSIVAYRVGLQFGSDGAVVRSIRPLRAGFRRQRVSSRALRRRNLRQRLEAVQNRVTTWSLRRPSGPQPLLRPVPRYVWRLARHPGHSRAAANSAEGDRDSSPALSLQTGRPSLRLYGAAPAEGRELTVGFELTDLVRRRCAWSKTGHSGSLLSRMVLGPATAVTTRRSPWTRVRSLRARGNCRDGEGVGKNARWEHDAQTNSRHWWRRTNCGSKWPRRIRPSFGRYAPTVALSIDERRSAQRGLDHRADGERRHLNLDVQQQRVEGRS
jgi:hypothetical protein